MRSRVQNKININTAENFNRLYTKPFSKKALDVRTSFYIPCCPFMAEDEASLMDMGCGSGAGLEYMAQTRPHYLLYGYDFSETALKKSADRCPKASYTLFDLLIQELDRMFDYICLFEVLEHLEEPELAINKLLPYCRRLFITIPYGDNYIRDAYHIMSGFIASDFDKFPVIHSEKIRSNRNLFVVIKGVLDSSPSVKEMYE
jgi:2-polyprenyl-3-methyl-5-hydroxy-6-metoxy-1,4-benzoquinol methylase